MSNYANCFWHTIACYILFCCILAEITECAEARQDGAVVYVACDGDDTWSGSLPSPNPAKTDGPVATVHRAIELARRNRGDSQEGYAVQIRQGTYYLSESLVFGDKDSGTSAVPTVIGAYQDEHPILVGARRLEGWNSHQDSILRTSLTENGLKGDEVKQLFAGGRRLILARYPNHDPAKPLTGGWAYVDSQAPAASILEAVGQKRAFRVRKEDNREWSHPERGRVFIFPGHEWWNSIVPIAAVDQKTGTVSLKRDCSYEIVAEDRYYVSGLREELDARGEWCVDHSEGFLYLWPTASPDEQPVYASVVRTILEMDTARNVRIQGLTFEYCDGHAVSLKECEECLIAACTVRNVGDYHGSGVRVSGGRGNGVVGCDIHDTGSNGISLLGGDQTTRTPAGNYAENNHITRTGVYYKQGAGVSLQGVGNRVSRNTIHHVPRWAIGFGGNDHLIELNHLHHVSTETTDTGAIYGGSLNWLSAHGVVIRHNFIHDVIGRGRRSGTWQAPFFGWGIYLDWTAMGVTVFGNIVARAPRAGIMVHDGRFNTIENNIIVDCGTSEYEPGSQIEYSGWDDTHFYWERGLERGWVKQFESVKDQPAWQGEASTLRDPRASALPDRRTMHSNTLRQNILFGCSPKAKTFRFRNVSFGHNPSDHNLLWHGGEEIRTGLLRVKEEKGANLITNPSFEQGDASHLPEGWQARLPWKACKVSCVDDNQHDGRRSLVMVGVASTELEGRPAWEREVSVQTDFIRQVVPGQDYRVSAWLKAAQPGTRIRLEALSYKGGVYDVRLCKAEATIGSEWQKVEGTFRFPSPDEGAYRPGLETTFYVRVILRQDDGTLWLDDVTLRHAVMMNELEAWQSEGMDCHSIVADPLFWDRESDDYRLRAESPAWDLGFERIPIDQIGCYLSPMRASWPISSEDAVPDAAKD